MGGERKGDPDWQRFHLIGATNTVYFALLARRRMDLYGATVEDFAQVKVKNSRHGLDNPNARYRKENSIDDVLASPVVSDPLRLLDICATSDGAAALIVASKSFTEKHLGSVAGVPSVRAISTVTPKYPQHLPELPDIATDSTAAVPAPERVFKDQILDAAYAEAGIGPEDLSLAEVYDLSTALELDWYEHLGLCPKGEAEALLRSGATTLGGRVPVNPSGGLACFGEAIPAQAIAQVCELTWQLRGQATGRQVADAKVGVTANQGLFGHGSSVIVAARSGHRPAGGGRQGRRHRQPGPVRARLVGDRRGAGAKEAWPRRAGAGDPGPAPKRRGRGGLGPETRWRCGPSAAAPRRWPR